MKLVIIYGPPGAGKLTVAKELAKLTGYRVFHNHVTLDAVEEVLPKEAKRFWHVVNDCRVEIIDAAAQERISLIFTGCFGYGHDEPFMRRMIRAVERHSGKVVMVHLCPPPQVLRTRVPKRSRSRHGKLRKVSTLNIVLKKFDFYTSYPSRKSLRIDNTKLSAKKVAKLIQQHYRL